MKHIGKYQVVEKIGVGGFGEVYKAYDPFIKRHVAIKTCSSDDQEVRNRFFQEAEIAGNLHHRNITTVYDFGIQDTLPYLIQEYLSGEDLDRKIKRRDFLPFPEKLYYLLQIARGMAHAHSKGVIHRDIKPANIRILEDGAAKIMDFGIAKLAQQETGLTQTGMTLGTAAYLAPEQIRGDPVNHRTDVFSFGVLAYELVTYERPFQGEQISAVLYQILNHEPKPIPDNVNAAVPSEIVDLVHRCLHKEPAKRFDSGGELLKELELIQKKGRADRHRDGEEQPSPAADAATVITPARSAAEVSPRSGIVQSRATATTRQQGLDEIELTSVQQERKPPSVMPLRNPAGPPRSSSTLRNVIILAVLAIAVALGAGIWLGNLGKRSTDTPPGETPSQETDGAGTEDSTAAAGEDAEPTSSPPSTAQDPGQSTPPAEGEAPGAETATPEAPPPPPPEPEPEPGRLVVPKVEWTDAMTVQVGRRGRKRPLTRQHVLTLEAATYTVTFEVTGDYQATVSMPVQLGEGETRTVPSPIPEPGALTVRASLGKPQGQVVLGERILGQSPIRKVMTAPGEHRIQIRPLSGEGAPLDKQVNVQSGQETILTFDLEAGSIRDSVKPLDE